MSNKYQSDIVIIGGGGIHGSGSLEGTFLGSCVLTGRIAGKIISEEKPNV